MTLQLRYAARSHAGLLRPLNEDSVYAGPRLLAVADGMGGHAAGEVASAVAIASLAPLDDDVPGPDLLAALLDRARTTNQTLREMVAGEPDLEGMGTTLVALLFSGKRLGLLHIGDSRCYLLRAGELTQITHDHTFVQSLVDEGRITEDEAASHPKRSIITKVLDGRDDLEPDLSVREAQLGDRYLLCSDGLTGPVGSHDTLRETLSIEDPQEACDRLVALALRGGGPDNITVVVADIVDSDDIVTTPIVDGAASDHPQAAPPGITDSPASRARVAEGRDTPPPARLAAPVARRTSRRTAAGALLVLLILAGVAMATFAYVRSQYYVGLDNERVAVLRGVRGSVAGVELATVQERTTLGIERLSVLDRARLEDGIVAHDQRDARAIVQRLIVAACPTPAPTPATVPTPPATPLPAPTPTPTPTPTPCP